MKKSKKWIIMHTGSRKIGGFLEKGFFRNSLQNLPKKEHIIT